MKGKTHLLAGLVTGYSLTNDWKGGIIGAIAGLLPDIDEPHSTIGRLFFFLSFPLNKLVGHRTLTHSLLFLAAGYVALVANSSLWALAFVGGVASHILGDLVTGKVKLLYPLSLSFGVDVSRVGYHMMDLSARLALTLLVLMGIWREAVSFTGFF